MTIENVGKLHASLVAELGQVISGVNSNGIVNWRDGHPVDDEQSRADTIIAAHDPTEEIATQQVFILPLVAPDFIVQSPKPKKDHLEAHAEAIAESKKSDKSLALMVLDLMVYVEELEKRLQKLEKK